MTDATPPVAKDNQTANTPPVTPSKRPKIRMKVSKKRKEGMSPVKNDAATKKQRLLGVPDAQNSGLSPAYGVPEGVDISGLSPSYTGLSPAYGLSPSYGSMSPSKANPWDLGGTLNTTIMRMLEELSPTGRIETNIVCVTPDTTVAAALDKLADHKILAMPVVSSEGQYLDIVDNFDIMRFITKSFTDAEVLAVKQPTEEEQAAKWHDMAVKGKEVFKHTVKDLIAARRTDKADVQVTTLEASDTVSKLLYTFLKSRMADGRAYHRLVLLTKERRIRCLVSQSDILKYLFRHDVNVRPASRQSEKTLEELGMTKRRVAVVRHNSSVLYAFFKMVQLGAHSIAVTKEGKLLRHFSASDLRGFTSESFPKLLTTVGLYTTRKPATLPPNATLWEAISTLVGKRLHRCCVVDANGCAFSLVSIANLLAGLMEKQRVM